MESLKNPVGNLAIPGRMRSAQSSKQNGFFKLVMATLIGVMVGYAIGGSFPSDIAIWKAADRGWYFGRVNIHRRDLKNSLKEQEIEARNSSKIYVRTNPRGAELLPPGIIEARSDLFLRRLWGDPTEDLEFKQKYLLVLTVGYKQKEMVNSMLSRFSDNFSFLLFHYDGRASEWEELDWSQRAIHVSVRKQAKWWYAKRFLHPDIVAPYDYIFIWDEDLGVDHFNAEEYIRLVKKHGLEISQPALEDNDGLSWLMTKRRHDVEVHKTTEERPGWCSDPHLPPCAGFVEIMAPVFSRDSWRCVWHMIQNDLVHGWGLDLALQRCVRPAHEKIGVVDDQWLLHKVVPSLGDQGESKDGRQPWEGVRERCKYEWSEFKSRLQKADKDYFEELYQ